LGALRQKTPYPIFAPTFLPAGFAISSLREGDDHTPGIAMRFHDAEGKEALLILNGPSGCCLDAYSDKSGETVELANRIAAHYLKDIEPQYGGAILWWDQDRTYVALSSPYLDKATLIRVANSMSKTAELTR